METQKQPTGTARPPILPIPGAEIKIAAKPAPEKKEAQ
jgi:hypothetical protein